MALLIFFQGRNRNGPQGPPCCCAGLHTFSALAASPMEVGKWRTAILKKKVTMQFGLSPLPALASQNHTVLSWAQKGSENPSCHFPSGSQISFWKRGRHQLPHRRVSNPTI